MDRPLQHQQREQGGLWTVVAILATVAIFLLLVYQAHQSEVHRAQQRRYQAANDVHVLQPIAEKWVSDHMSCTTAEGLYAAGELSPSKLTDPWGTPYVIVCGSNGDVVVSSAGPDCKLGTGDDITPSTPVHPAWID